MLRSFLIGLLYRVVLALPEVLLKDKNLARRSRCKELLFNTGEQLTLDDKLDSTK